MEKKVKEVYEVPTVTVVEFELHDSIASSGDFGSDTACSETVWGTE